MNIMKYEVINKWNDMDFGGSGVQGGLICSKSKLVELFGAPMQVNSARTEYRWLIKFEDGTRAIITKDPKDEQGKWCINGFGYKDKEGNNLSVKRVMELVNV